MINPVKVTVVKNDKASQSEVKPFREVKWKAIEGTSYTFKAQPKWFVHNEPTIKNFGVSEETSGYIIVRVYDMNKIGLTLERGDKITKIGKRTDVWWITEVRPYAVYEDQGGDSLLKATFHDRKP